MNIELLKNVPPMGVNSVMTYSQIKSDRICLGALEHQVCHLTFAIR